MHTPKISRRIDLYGILISLLLICFAAGAATDRHVAHGTSSKLITFDHQVRRDLFHAERENVRSTAASSSIEVPYEPAYQSESSIPLVDVFANAYPTGLAPAPFHFKTFPVDRLTVLNL